MSKIVDLTGKIFGELTVKSRLHCSRGGSVMWECLCSCGNKHEASTRHLNRTKNTVKSCGCLKKRRGKQSPFFRGYEGISMRWWLMHIKHSANCKGRQKIELSIDLKYAWDLFLAQEKRCFFTDELLVLTDHQGQNTASLDRIDNTLGYVSGNVRWVHKIVNMMKRTYSDEHFISWCKLVAKNN